MSNSPFWHNLFRPPQKQKETICNLWLDTPIFDGISHSHCLKLAKEMPIRRYNVDEAVFTQGEIGIGTCLILKGSVKICAGSKVLATMEQGDFFGEVALVIEAPRTATAIASTDCEIVFFLRPQLEQLLSQAPRLGSRLMQNLARIIANRLGSTNALLEAHHVTE
jgi:CRP/FNR family cyclic AMP-dependent transcriptional regulator